MTSGEADSIPAAPGSGATTVHGCRIWSELWSVMTSRRSRLSLIWWTAIGNKARNRAPEGEVWPLPLPFPEMHKKRAKRFQQDAERKLGLNFLVLVMNSLAAGRRHFRNAMPGVGTPLNRQQWEVVGRLAEHVNGWNSQPPVSASDMGRSAVKVEGMEDLLSTLAADAAPLAADLRNYLGRALSGMQTSWGNRHNPGEVVGSLTKDVACLAKPIEPQRLKFWETPSFDPSAFMDFGNLLKFVRPLDYAQTADEDEARPPRVSFRCKGADVVAFLELLDSSNRLALVPKSKVRLAFRNGAFSIPKDASRDRMVLDARPPNILESNDDPWIRSLGSLSQFNHYFLKSEEQAFIYAEDLREYYHAFLISRQCTLRNAFKLEVQPWQVRHLTCFDGSLVGKGALVPCLKTMAMGDLNAVSFGQVSHLSVLLSTGKLRLEDFTALSLRPPRGDFMAGLMIDDFLMFEKRTDPGVSERADEVSREVVKKYEEVKLPRHSGKAVHDEQKAVFWGASFDGDRGELRPAYSRVIPLAFLVLKMLHLGQTSVGLLEVLAGSFVAAFQLRRRLMATLEEIYAAQRGRLRTDVISFSTELHDELLTLVAMLVVAQTDFRLQPSTRLIASDASSGSEAAVYTTVPGRVTEELQRHALQRGMWNRLLSPCQAYMKEKGWLEPELELPEGAYDMHPLWEELVMTQQFLLQEKPRRVLQRRHINIGEIRAALRAEQVEGLRFPNSYYVHLQDSQVALASLVKGRSSSRHLNAEIRASIPIHVGFNVRPFFGFVRSKKNPADDPTRGQQIRRPAREAAQWMQEMWHGDYVGLDSMLKEQGLERMQLSGLPGQETLVPFKPVDLQRGGVVRADARRSLRKNKVWNKAAYSEDEGDCVGVREDEEGFRGEPTAPGSDSSLMKVREELEDDAEAEGSEEVPNSPLQLPDHRCFSEAEDAFEDEGDGASAARTTHTARKEDFANAEGKRLSEEALELLRSIPSSQFVFSKDFASLEEAWASGPGYLDLFSGSRGLAKAIVGTAKTWVLTYDISHDLSEDLLSFPVQRLILRMIRASCFRAMSAGPVCASFSTAVTPPVRTREFPAGVNWCSERQQQKNIDGNAMLAFVIRASRCCLRHGVLFLVENPDGSWMWRQVEEQLDWGPLLATGKVGDFRTDFCRYGTAWRKRTRFRTSLNIRGQKVLCACKRKHLQLRGRCAAKGCNYTKLAEPYPRSLCRILALALVGEAGMLGEVRPLDVAACAKLGTLRAGEAANPGPRAPRVMPRQGHLGSIEVLEPATVALRDRLWTDFCCWFEAEFGRDVLLDWIGRAPAVFVSSLIAYGNMCYSEGFSLHYFRQLLAHVQRVYVNLKVHMSAAWELVTRWQSTEPVAHRVPLPEPLLQAGIALALLWGWRRWAAVTMYCFYAISRVGEVLKARRSEALTPRDILFEQNILFLKVLAPKSRNRGARMQYSSTDVATAVAFVSSVWDDLMPDEYLFPGSASSYRSRWDKIFQRLGVSSAMKLTPGSLRGGGAVSAHRAGTPIANILWKMRLAHQKTLSFYLQEVSASSVLPSLSDSARENIQLLRSLLPVLIKTQGPQRTAMS